MVDTRIRAERLYDNGIGVADAAHVAFAEAAGANFVTCDDRLLKRCLKIVCKYGVAIHCSFVLRRI